jgi:hypothetical protein
MHDSHRGHNAMLYTGHEFVAMYAAAQDLIDF